MSILFHATRLHPGSIAQGGNVVLDTILTASGGITYQPDQGIITLNKCGRYWFDWWVAAGSAASLTLVCSDGNQTFSCASPSGEISGMALVTVAQPPVAIALQNSAGAVLTYPPDAALCASLAILTADHPG